MKVLVSLPDWPHLEIHGSSDEVVNLLQALKKKSTPTGAEEKSVAMRTENDAALANPNPRQPSISSVTKRQTPQNRRQMVLTVMEHLQEGADDCFRIRDIVSECQKRFPDADTKHLDQVIRDLANKTNLVESPSRGMFRLVIS